MTSVLPASETSISFSAMPGSSALNLKDFSSSVMSTAGNGMPNVESARNPGNGNTPRPLVNLSNNRSISLRNERQISGVPATACVDRFVEPTLCRPGVQLLCDRVDEFLFRQGVRIMP
jgi:hypothetical protein